MSEVNVNAEEFRVVTVDAAESLDRVTAERDAALGREAALREELDASKRGLTVLAELDSETIESMQQRLTAADERVDVLERVDARYRWLQKSTPYRFKKIQDASVTEGGDVLYFHADRFDAAVDAELKAEDGGGDAS